jgi:hypothetical protein
MAEKASNGSKRFPSLDAPVMTAEEGEASEQSRCYVHIVEFQDVGLVW